MEMYLHCIYKNMHGTDKHKMKDDIYFSQDGKMKLGRCFKIIRDTLFLKKQTKI